ncbi:hypothetical protein [Variovorax boronicumulans]|uniref:hypothetical protein n=1 Tax=Variovorax boronicumulans TaxID=436515 RepID=UPI001C565127
MSHSDPILNIVTIANHGEGLMTASEAVRVIADLIDRLDPSCEGDAQEMEALLRIGATVWHQQLLQQPSAKDPRPCLGSAASKAASP